jgi:hypothetical protein
VRGGIPSEVDDVVMTALVRDPEQRWQSAAAMRGALGVLGSRKNLRATGADVVYWIDWLFGLGARPSQRRRAEPDTGPDAPSITLERSTTTDEVAMLPPDVMPAKSASSSTQLERPKAASDRMITVPMRPAPATWEDSSATTPHGMRSVSAITDVEIGELDAAILAEAPAPPPGGPTTLVGVDAPPTNKSGPVPNLGNRPTRDSKQPLATGTPHDTSQKPTNFLTLGDDYLAAAEAYRSSYQTPVPGSVNATGSAPPTTEPPAVALPEAARPVELPPRPPPSRWPLIILILALCGAAALTGLAALYLG